MDESRYIYMKFFLTIIAKTKAIRQTLRDKFDLLDFPQEYLKVHIDIVHVSVVPAELNLSVS